MKKVILLSTLLASSIFAGEIEWGHGTIKLNGGLLGLDSEISDDIDTYSMVERHKNLLGSNFFYGYTATLFDSKKMKQLQKTYNTGVSQANTILKPATSSSKYIKIPEMEHRLQGADVGITLGYDVLHTDENNYLGIGLYGGLSIPYIESSKSDSNNPTKIAGGTFEKSKTDLTTYKIGAGVYAQKSLSDFISIYGSGVYAYQTGNIKNSYAKSDLDIDGNYMEFTGGLKFQALKDDYKLGSVTISPRLYGTIGLRHREWKVNDVAINTSGISTLKAPKSDMKFSSDAFTVGVGYSF